MADSSEVGDSCVVCGKPRREVNLLFVVPLHPLVCSARCVQRAFDKERVTFHFPDGHSIKAAPGTIKMSVDHGYPVYEGEWPSQSLTVTVEESGMDEKVGAASGSAAGGGNVLREEIVLPESGVCNLPTPREVRIYYGTDWKGESGWRRIVPLSIGFEKSKWRPVQHWVLHAFDVDRGEEGSFAIQDIKRWEVPSLAPKGGTAAGQ